MSSRSGQLFVKTEPKEGVRALRVEAACRFAVLPDFFADDIMLDATELPVARAELPSENFLVEMLEGNDAVLMNVWTDRDEDVAVTLNGQAAAKRIDGAEIQYGAKGNVWVAVMTAPQIWHARDIGRKDTDKVIPLEWKEPFAGSVAGGLAQDGPAGGQLGDDHGAPGRDVLQVRVVPRHGQDSGRPRQGGRRCSATYRYPCWIDKNGRGILQPQSFEHHARFEGPTLIYPIIRLADTPLDAYTVVDVVRATLGVGPCEYILDVEGQRAHSMGIATCAMPGHPHADLRAASADRSARPRSRGRSPTSCSSCDTSAAGSRRT